MKGGGGSVRTPEKFEGWSRYQSSRGADSPKSALETADHVSRAEHSDPIKSCLVRGDLHMTVHLLSKGNLLTAALKEMRRTRAECLLQWHAENGRENILFTDEKIFTIEEQRNNQNKTDAKTSLEVHSEGAGMPLPLLRHGLVGGVPSRGDTSSFLQERGETGVRMYQEDVPRIVVKQLNMVLFSGQEWVFQQDSVPAQKQRRLWSGCERTLRPLSEPRFGPWGVQTSPLGLWTVGVLEDMVCRKRHNNLDSPKRSLVKEAAEIPLETGRTALAEWPESLKACVELEGGHFEWLDYK